MIRSNQKVLSVVLSTKAYLSSLGIIQISIGISKDIFLCTATVSTSPCRAGSGTREMREGGDPGRAKETTTGKTPLPQTPGGGCRKLPDLR
jgi:hypothetical protein